MDIVFRNWIRNRRLNNSLGGNEWIYRWSEIKYLVLCISCAAQHGILYAIPSWGVRRDVMRERLQGTIILKLFNMAQQQKHKKMNKRRRAGISNKLINCENYLKPFFWQEQIWSVWFEEVLHLPNHPIGDGQSQWQADDRISKLQWISRKVGILLPIQVVLAKEKKRWSIIPR